MTMSCNAAGFNGLITSHLVITSKTPTTVLYYVSTTDSMDETHTTTAIPFSTGTAIPGVAGISVSVFVGTLVGVISLLVLLMAVIVTVILSCMFMNKHKVLLNRQQVREDHGSDQVPETVRELMISGASNPIELTANEAYGTHIQDVIIDNVLESQTTETQYDEIH